ncbi:hypothetical protein SDD30_04410 [Moorella naiadis]|uniref:hypothetical protein n=1 Tax=Moorella naiadis (nom. illeg.) TaxID=3093670 RepID=UPI003D9CAE2C
MDREKATVQKEERLKERLPNYWDLGDKTAAEHFTRDFLKFLLPGLQPQEVTLLDKEIVKETFRSWVESDQVVKIILADGSSIGVIQEFQRYHDPTIWERLWEYAVLLKRKHGLTILPILVDYNKEKQGGNPVTWQTRPMMQLGLPETTVTIATFTCLVFKVNSLQDTELLSSDEPGIWPLLPFTRTRMTPGEMVAAIAKRLVELKVAQEYIDKILTMLGYYLEGMYSPQELEEFNETLRRWKEMSLQLKYIGQPWREEGKLEKAREDIIEVLEERFGIVDDSVKQKLAMIEDPGKLKILLRKSIKIGSLAEFTGLF